MDPIRTAVKYALVPLRIVVQLGDAFLGAPEQARPTPAREPERPQPRRRDPRPKPDPQRTSSPKALDDVGLARKVETVIFRDPGVPKGSIDVNAADGVVWLRGEAKTPEMIRTLESRTREIPEVRKVENVLHLPQAPAPTRRESRPITTAVNAEPGGPPL